MAEFVAVLVVSVVNEINVDWLGNGVRPHRLKRTKRSHNHKYLYHMHAPIFTAHVKIPDSYKY